MELIYKIRRNFQKRQAWRRIKKLGFEFHSFRYRSEDDEDYESWANGNIIIYADAPKYWGQHSEYRDLSLLFDHEKDDCTKKNKKKKSSKKGKEKDHKKLKWFEHKIIHLIATFILGVALATVFHVVITNHQVRTTAEAVCNVFGRDAEECKGGIDDVLNMSDNVLDNNINVKGE